MGNYLTHKIRILTFIAAIFIVLQNCYNYSATNFESTTAIAEGFNITAMIQYTFCNGISAFALPIVFFVTGFTSFRYLDITLKGFFHKLKSKAIPILVTYVFWASFACLIIFISLNVSALKDLPFIKDMYDSFSTHGLFSLLLFPPNHQLSVLLNILFFVVYYPILYLILKYFKIFSLVIFSILWISDISIGISTEGLLFFAVGAYLALFIDDKYHVNPVATNTLVIGSIVWIGLCAVKTYWAATVNINEVYTNKLGLTILHKLSVLLGVLVVWYMADRFTPYLVKSKFFMKITKQSIFIFLSHEVFLIIFSQFILQHNNSDTAHLLVFIASFVIITLLSIVIGMLIKKLCKFVYNCITCGKESLF